MSKKIKEKTVDQHTQNKYDEICGITFVNIYTLTKNCPGIVISPFDAQNKEHLYLLNVAKGVAGVYGKTVFLDTSAFQLWRLNRKIKDKDCRMKKASELDKAYAINPNEILDFMRGFATDACGTEFTFGDIYESFYTKGIN